MSKDPGFPPYFNRLFAKALPLKEYLYEQFRLTAFAIRSQDDRCRIEEELFSNIVVAVPLGKSNLANLRINVRDKKKGCQVSTKEVSRLHR